MNKKTFKNFIGKGIYVLMVSIMAFSPLIGATPTFAAVVDLEDFDGTDVSSLLSAPGGFNQGTGGSFIYGAGSGKSGSDAIDMNGVNNVWTSKDALDGLEVGGDGYRVSAMFHHEGNGGFGGLGFSTQSTNSLTPATFPPTVDNALTVAVHGGGTNYVINGDSQSFNHDIDGDIQNGWYLIELDIAKIGDNEFVARHTITAVDQNGASEQEGDVADSNEDDSEIFTFTSANNGESLYPFFFAYAGDRFDFVDDFAVEDQIENWAYELPPVEFAGGDGSSGDPYQIETCAQLQAMQDNLASNYILNNTIDCSDSVNWNSGEGFMPIGTYNDKFTGNLDGNGNTIENLTINRPSLSDIGLFGSIDSIATISDLGMWNPDITGAGTVGTIAGSNDGLISRSYAAQGTVTGNGDNVGGLVGTNDGEIENAYSQVTSVSSSGGWVAGIAGFLGGAGTIDKVYSTSDINSSSYKAGVAVGNSSGIQNSFYDTDTSGIGADNCTDSGNTAGCSGLSTAQMNNQSNFIVAGWDFESVWLMPDGYPVIQAPSEGGGGEDTEFAGGDGSVEDPYQINSCAQLQSVNDDLESHYILIDNVDCSESEDWNGGAGFTPIADNSDGAFNGTFNGDGYEISDLHINIDSNKVGLFAEISETSEIRNLGVIDAYVSGTDAVGILVGVSYGTIEDSYTTGIVYGDDEVGGLVGGHMGWDTIRDSYSEATVNGDDSVGGLSGSNYGNIYNSYATGDVFGNEEVGGLVGRSVAGETEGEYMQNEIAESSASGNVTVPELDFENIDYYEVDNEAYSKIGGLVGESIGTYIENSYATGEVIGFGKVGGLVGQANVYQVDNYDGDLDQYIYTYLVTEIVDSYASGNVYGNDEIGGFIGDANGVEISRSSATGNVYGELASLYEGGDFIGDEGASNVGGFIGEMDVYYSEEYNNETLQWVYAVRSEGLVEESYATGNVEGNSDVGGFAGEIDDSLIRNSYARGNVTAINEGAENVGGFAGATYTENSDQTIDKVYSTGVVDSETEIESIGGLVGYMDNDDEAVDSFWDVNASGMNDSFGGTSKTVSQMKTEATFTDADWDFDNIWDIESERNDGYAILINNNGDQDDLEGYEEPSEEPQQEPRRRSSGGGKKKVTTPTTTSVSTPSTSGNSSSTGFNRSLQLGSSGLDVKQLQQFLNSNGFKVAEAGPGSPTNETETFGPATQSALARFQAANGITPAAGYFGPLTQAFIAAFSPMTQLDTSTPTEPVSTPTTGVRDLELGMSGDDVKALQTFLISMKHRIEAGATGYFGQQTKDALIEYQTSKGITPASGYFGAVTRGVAGI